MADPKRTDHIAAWSAVAGVFVAIVLGVFNRMDLADSKRDFEGQKKLFDDKMTGLSSAIEKSTRLEVSPRLQFEVIQERVELAEETIDRFTEVRLKNIGRGHAFKVFVDVNLTGCRLLPYPHGSTDLSEFRKLEPRETEVFARTSQRIVEDKTITTGSSIDHLHVEFPFQVPNEIQGMCGHIRVRFSDEDGNETIDIQPFAIVIIPYKKAPVGWLELPSPVREKDWRESHDLQLLFRELSKAQAMMIAAPAEAPKPPSEK